MYPLSRVDYCDSFKHNRRTVVAHSHSKCQHSLAKQAACVFYIIKIQDS